MYPKVRKAPGGRMNIRMLVVSGNRVIPNTPTEQEVKTWYAPLAQKMIMEFSAKEERYFQHFKGGKYKFIHSAFDSETQERMVVYQALYGDQAYWVRPEDMFFGKVTRDGRTFNRFTEIDK